MSPASQSNRNVLYAQAGGVTAVINASAAAVIETVNKHPDVFGKCYAAENGIKGVLEEQLIDLSQLQWLDLEKMKSQPGAVFKACRFDLDPLEHNPAQYERVLAVFKAYEIGYFFYNGGNGSMVTAQKVSDYCREHGHEVKCIGVAKTIDNDLALSHCSPGFGSAVKYLATSFAEACADIYSMHETSTKFFVMEAMGRDVGWLSLSAALVKDIMPELPLIILPAERRFNLEAFKAKMDQKIAEQGYCVCMVSEGLKNQNGDYLSIAGIEHTHERDYTQLGGVGKIIAEIAADHLGCKTHCAIPDYLQRSASHCVSDIDWKMAYGAGQASVLAAIKGEHGKLPVVQKIAQTAHDIEWTYQSVHLEEVANLELKVPDEFLTEDGMDVTEAGRNYLRPLIQGERQSKFVQGLPDIGPLKFTIVPAKLPKFHALK